MTALSEAIKADIVARIFRAVKPGKIFLFGSAANDEMGPDSDIDLLIVVAEVENPRALSTQIRRQLRGVPFPFDILVKSQEQFDRFKDVVGSIFYTALKHGQVIYASDDSIPGGEALAKFLDQIPGLNSLVKTAPPRIDSAGSIEIGHEFVDVVRFRPRGRCVVQIDELFPR